MSVGKKKKERKSEDTHQVKSLSLETQFESCSWQPWVGEGAARQAELAWEWISTEPDELLSLCTLCAFKKQKLDVY